MNPFFIIHKYRFTAAMTVILVMICFSITSPSLTLCVTASAPTGDPVYDSMTQPSESQSDFMISAGRDYGHILADTSSEESQKVLAIGSLYRTTNATLPSTFSVYHGKITTFAYSLSKNCWIIIDSQPYPSGIYIYTLPWTSSSATKCKNVTYTDSYAKVDLTSEELTNNVLHFWAKPTLIDKNDYLFYASAYDFWVDSPAEGKLTAAGGIDTKDIAVKKTIVQLYSSRGLSSSTELKTLWGHTVPEPLYHQYNTSSLNDLYKFGQLKSDLSQSIKKTDNDHINPKLSKPTPKKTIPKSQSFFYKMEVK